MIPPAPTEILGMMASFAAKTRTDGVTLWLADGTELVATANPLEPGVPGLRQPLTRGIISQVYLTGIGMIESDPADNPVHDDSVDRRLGKRTATVMAAPVDLGPHGDGVLSCVRHEGGQSGPFDLPDLAALERLAATITGRFGA